jgi:arginine deiminase
MAPMTGTTNEPLTPTAPAALLDVASEVGTLRRVLLHRPDLELRRLTPSNKDALLFDDVLWVRRARQEHDAFADALQERGVEVLYLHELLAETLNLYDARAEIFDATFAAAALGPLLEHELRSWLWDMDGEELASRLIGGVSREEGPVVRGSLAWQVAQAGDFLLDPLPNHLFTRDTSCWIYNGVSVNAMAKPARRREAVHLSAIYRHHPLFTERAFSTWSDDLGGPAQLEGGDVLVIGRAVLVDMGERTRPGAVERLARRLFDAGAATRVIAICLPAQRSSMHLDSESPDDRPSDAGSAGAGDQRGRLGTARHRPSSTRSRRHANSEKPAAELVSPDARSPSEHRRLR